MHGAEAYSLLASSFPMRASSKSAPVRSVPENSDPVITAFTNLTLRSCAPAHQSSPSSTSKYTQIERFPSFSQADENCTGFCVQAPRVAVVPSRAGQVGTMP